MTTFVSIAQSESEAKSRNIKWGMQYRFSNGTSALANRVCYGYKHSKEGELVPDEEKADIVRMIFRLYLEGKSLLAISKELHKLRIPSPTGKETWTSCAIDKLLSNEKYIGEVLLQKTFVPDMFHPVQIKNNGERMRYLYENNHVGIIDREVFDAVQLEKERRSRRKV